MPQCLSPPDFKTKSPAIAEQPTLDTNTTTAAHFPRFDKLDLEMAPATLNLVASKLDLDFEKQPFVNYDYYRKSTEPLDDFVYLEFFVDTIKPEYHSPLQTTSLPSSAFTNCVNTFKLSNGISHFRLFTERFWGKEGRREGIAKYQTNHLFEVNETLFNWVIGPFQIDRFPSV